MATREELDADRAALVSARRAVLSGKSVKEYWRDGRRVVYATISPEQITTAIADIDAEILDLAAATGRSRPRFHALSVRFGGCR